MKNTNKCTIYYKTMFAVSHIQQQTKEMLQHKELNNQTLAVNMRGIW